MKGVIFIGILTISCSKKEGVVPVDPIIAKFTREFTGTWKVVFTECGFNSSSNNYTTIQIDNPDCSKEQQWDYVKQMTITSDLKISNDYWCSSTKTTYFELKKEKGDSTIVITEKDNIGNMIKIYTVNPNAPPNSLWLTSTTFDRSYFYDTKPGSFPLLPNNYILLIQKQ